MSREETYTEQMLDRLAVILGMSWHEDEFKADARRDRAEWYAIWMAEEEDYFSSCILDRIARIRSKQRNIGESGELSLQ